MLEEKTVMDALVQMKRTGNLLSELLDLTQQLGEAIDRNDQVSTEMLIAMREDPLGKLQVADQALREQLEALPDPFAAQLASMLNGGEPVEEDSRAQLLLRDQVASNRRRLKQVQDLDRVLSQRLGREQSVYQ